MAGVRAVPILSRNHLDHAQHIDAILATHIGPPRDVPVGGANGVAGVTAEGPGGVRKPQTDLLPARLDGRGQIRRST